ncbi:uncharacterized protein LOC127431273 [Myxocyprinus asiaticus]|uniref:uncharacterized protein LOC127431273 n=1 Tax=Myxocyprinus asiaticus TaxID=70543 RepID=UPI002223ED88|nr:uncharacterized protein LOC127431273 [Myxocyprinus asiaticus]XP_051537609.1 uncharacterized protein LOC127431273 [Myxocyprinus asiaticus]
MFGNGRLRLPLQRHFSQVRRIPKSISGVTAAMPTELATESTVLQTPAQTVDSYRNLIVLKTSDVPVRKPSSLNHSSMGCRTSALPQICWGLELNVVVLLMVLAGLLILVLIYYVLLLRHRLRVAQAGNALEYFGFYHMAQYDLKQPGPRHLPEATPQVSTSPVTIPSPPPQPPPVIKPLSIHPPLHLTPPPPPSLLHLSHPVIYTTPPSPHPSCGAGSDAEVYSCISVLRPSRPSSVSQTQVILFEHSAL